MPRPCRLVLFAVVLVVFVAGGLAACQSGGLSALGASGEPSAEWQAAAGSAPEWNGSQRTRPGSVSLSAQDLAPVDAFLKASNAQWILGDTVDVYASKEYFSSMLTMNQKIGLVHRKDERVGDDEVSTLTFIGHETQRSAMANPRVMIGTGLTVSARNVLRVRMARTTDANRPVRLRVLAQGDAVHGRRDDVLERGPSLQLGGMLKRVEGRWRWRSYGGGGK